MARYGIETRTTSAVLMYWLGFLAKVLLPVGLFAISVIGASANHAHAMPPAPATKLSPDLAAAVTAPSVSDQKWIKQDSSGRRFKVIIIGAGSDPILTGLRNAVVSGGGSVYYMYQSVQGISAMVWSAQLATLAARSDVASISANRLSMKTASLLEATTGAATTRATQSGLDGTGVGIAIVDSGIYYNHDSFKNARGAIRVIKSVDFGMKSDAETMGTSDWAAGVDLSGSYSPGSKTQTTYEAKINSRSDANPDGYGHGTQVASVAAGRSIVGAPESAGIAPNANIYDVNVMDDTGIGQISDVLAGIDWVIYHSKDYNIRVMNVSMGADSTESYLTDPLCRAVRAATAAGIAVVVAAGNYGLNSRGVETYGTISSPGNDPSVITVGSLNGRNTVARGDDVVNGFSSRGPTRGGVDANGKSNPDNLLKPDLIAPGNRLLGAMSHDNTIIRRYPNLEIGGFKTDDKGRLMELSGTSVAAPVVAGTVALMLQANPGLTPPLIKAILQYTAQALPRANLVQQGAGALNVEGAVRLAKVLRTDIAGAVSAGTIKPGDDMLASGKSMPTPSSLINGETISWSRVAFAGGSHVLSGEVLFQKYQGFYDPRLTWVRDSVAKLTPVYWTGSGPSNTYMRYVVATDLQGAVLVTPGVVFADAIAGSTSKLSTSSGVFSPHAECGWSARPWRRTADGTGHYSFRRPGALRRPRPVRRPRAEREGRKIRRSGFVRRPRAVRSRCPELRRDRRRHHSRRAMVRIG